ncbi:MAG: hypothetical protein K8T20_10455 [Planctomycetes bacterium]|nr:hypothetical protein [Planctomycetota bacterium]
MIRTIQAVAFAVSLSAIAGIARAEEPSSVLDKPATVVKENRTPDPTFLAITTLTRRGEERLFAGQTEIQSPADALHDFRAGLVFFKQAWRLIFVFRLSADLPDGERRALEEEAAGLKQRIRAGLISTHLELGYAIMSRGSMKRAADEARYVLTFDADNYEALQLRILASGSGGYRHWGFREGWTKPVPVQPEKAPGIVWRGR